MTCCALKFDGCARCHGAGASLVAAMGPGAAVADVPAWLVCAAADAAVSAVRDCGNDFFNGLCSICHAGDYHHYAMLWRAVEGSRAWAFGSLQQLRAHDGRGGARARLLPRWAPCCILGDTGRYCHCRVAACRLLAQHYRAAKARGGRSGGWPEARRRQHMM